MDYKEFNKIFRARQAFERDQMITKSSEYASDADRLANFHNAAEFQALGRTPEAALWNMLVKHLVATRDAIDLLALGVVKPQSFWQEKLGDTRNYMVLLEALIAERQEEK